MIDNNNSYFTNLNFYPTPFYFYNEIEPYDALLSNINNLNEQNYSNFNYFNSNENEIINDHFFEDKPKEEKVKFQEFYNNANIYPHNGDSDPWDYQKNDFLGKKHFINNDKKIIFKKNRNNLNNYLFKTTKDKNEKSNNNISSETSSNTHIKKIKSFNKRNDSFLIKFKAFLGKYYIKHINNKLKKLTKRKIKFYAFNYKTFTLVATYNKNKDWLNKKMKDLLILGGEENQEKNEKALKSVYRRKEKEFDEIKSLLEMTYYDIIERFYSSKYFDEFKRDEKNIKANEEFVKVMKISLFEANGFITFLLHRKGNK